MVRDTSVSAYHSIIEEGLLSPLRETVYKYLYEYGPCTANELVSMLNDHGKGITSRDFYAQRLSELRDRDVVDEVGKRKCSITGRQAIVWKVNGRPPKKPVKKKRLCPHCGEAL